MHEEALHTVRLPVWKTVGSCYRALWNRQVAQMPFIWVIVALGMIGYWSSFRIFGSTNVDPRQVHTLLKTAPEHLVIALIGSIVTGALASGALTVSWLRYVLRGERPTGCYVGPAFWKYIAAGLMVGVAWAIGCIAISIPIAAGFSGYKLIRVLLVIVLLVALTLYVCRTYLKLTAFAIDDDTMTWRKSIALMKGNVIRVIFIAVVMSIPFSIINWLIAGILAMISNTIPMALLHGAFYATVCIYQAITLAMLMAITYRTLVGTHLNPSPALAAA